MDVGVSAMDQHVRNGYPLAIDVTVVAALESNLLGKGLSHPADVGQH